MIVILTEDCEGKSGGGCPHSVGGQTAVLSSCGCCHWVHYIQWTCSTCHRSIVQQPGYAGRGVAINNTRELSNTIDRNRQRVSQLKNNRLICTYGTKYINSSIIYTHAGSHIKRSCRKGLHTKHLLNLLKTHRVCPGSHLVRSLRHCC